MSDRCVVTGRGLVSALGHDPGAVHDALCEGRGGLAPVELFDATALTRPVAGEVKGFEPRRHLGERNLRPLDRTSRLVTVAAQLALDDAGSTPAGRAEAEVGLVLGTVYGSVRTIAEFDRRALTAGPSYASPMDFANTVINAPAGQAAIWHGLRGVSSTVSTGAASGLQAIAAGAALVAAGRAEALLAGGAEELAFESFLAMERAGLLALVAPDPVPFECPARGFLPGEGAGLLMLEPESAVARRGARPLAEVRGCGTGFDPSLGSDSGSARAAAERAIRAALVAGQTRSDELGGLLVGASGAAADEALAAALAGALGPAAASLPVAAPKASLGETLGADGGLQAVLAVESLLRGRLPGIRGFEPREGFALSGAGAAPQPLVHPCLLLLSGSADGHAAAVLLARPR